MKKNIFIPYPSMRDLREIQLLTSQLPYNIIFDACSRGALESYIYRAHDSNAMKKLLGVGIDERVVLCKKNNIQGIGYSCDYPGSPLSILIARQAGLSGPDPELILRLHHKYYARQLQKQYVPEVTPDFHIIGFDGTGKNTLQLDCPFFIKPVKSYLSICAYQVDSHDHLDHILATMKLSPLFLESFNFLLNRYCPLEYSAHHMIAESLLFGDQVTLEGYVFNGECTVMGITDSIMYPATRSFAQFLYPTLLSPEVIARMEHITKRLIKGIGLNNTMFNIEFMYDQKTDKISIIELNPRMAHQFADLYEKVDGTNGYQIMLDIAAGEEPVFKKGQGDYQCAASFVLRTFENMYAVHMPTPEDVTRLQQQFPDIRIELYAVEGALLDEQAQDTESYRYAIINVGGKNERDLKDRFEHCQQQLAIKLEPI